MEHISKRNSIELFAGAGGLGNGLAQAAFVPRIVVEHGRWCCNTLRDNHKGSAASMDATDEAWRVIEGDVCRVDFKPYGGKLDLVSGGPPCQPFSLGGRHRAYDDARDMFPDAVRAVRETRPEAFVCESVKGLTRAAFADYFSYVQLQLEHPEVLIKKNDGIKRADRLDQSTGDTRDEG